MAKTLWLVQLCFFVAAGHELTSTLVKIISHGGDCDHDGQSPNHYGAWGWELGGQLALASDRRDAGSSYAAFHAPAPDCRNNNWFRLDEQSPGVYKIIQHGGDCDHSAWAPNHYGMTGWELVVQRVFPFEHRDDGSLYASFHAPASDCRNNNHFRLEEQSPGVYTIISHGGDCDGSQWGANHYGTTGWELAVQKVHSTDRRDSESDFAFFISPAGHSDCRNNNHFAIVPADLYGHPVDGMATQLVSRTPEVRQVQVFAMLTAGLVAGVAVGAAFWRPCRKRSSGTVPLLAV